MSRKSSVKRVFCQRRKSPRRFVRLHAIDRAQDLFDSGKVRSFADLKGLKIAAAGPGSATNSKLNIALTKGGLTYKDSQNVNMSYPQQVAAPTSKAIDASIATEPLATQAINGGVAVRLSDDSLYPDQQVALLLYGSDLITKRRNVAERFMIAYVKAARVYNDATRGGRFDGPGSDAVVDLTMKTTGLKERDLFKSMIPNGISPDGAVIKRVSAKICAFSSPKA
jgi:NitT/TauT family transport system substrate-binding protein